jgi:hypothetical protein
MENDGVLYVVEMLRWGDRENHSYVIGVYSSQTLAALAGEAEKTWRAGKYEYAISLYQLDYIPQDKLDCHEKTQGDF